MNLRWLWLNHVPPGVTLSAEERAAIGPRIRALMAARKFIPPTVRNERWRFVGGVIALTVLFTVWILFNALAGPGGLMQALLTTGSILLFNIILWALIAWLLYRVSVPYVRLALNEMGHPVCLECGYPLHGLREEAVCPECGGARWRPDAPPTSSESPA